MGREQEAICSTCFLEFESSLVQEFNLFQELCKIHNFQFLPSLLRDWLQICCRVMRKIVLYVVCFAYSLLSVLLSLLVVVIVLVLVIPLFY